HVVRTSPEKDMPSMLTVAETGRLVRFLSSPTTMWLSPLRYPGGKSVAVRVRRLVLSMFSAFVTSRIVEPYAGGAGVALRLLKDHKVSKVVINDYDPDVFAFWNSAVNDSASFLERFDRRNPLSRNGIGRNASSRTLPASWTGGSRSSSSTEPTDPAC
ncbi:DNA adenine methylase, partial [Bifidobacterium longum]|uniref:DNA adenine methylase n=1 Tax=Bifidobacterium longum TaxID=216816 RepID=UPI0022836FF8